MRISLFAIIFVFIFNGIIYGDIDNNFYTLKSILMYKNSYTNYTKFPSKKIFKRDLGRFVDNYKEYVLKDNEMSTIYNKNDLKLFFKKEIHSLFKSSYIPSDIDDRIIFLSERKYGYDFIVSLYRVGDFQFYILCSRKIITAYIFVCNQINLDETLIEKTRNAKYILSQVSIDSNIISGLPWRITVFEKLINGYLKNIDPLESLYLPAKFENFYWYADQGLICINNFTTSYYGTHSRLDSKIFKKMFFKSKNDEDLWLESIQKYLLTPPEYIYEPE